MAAEDVTFPAVQCHCLARDGRDLPPRHFRSAGFSLIEILISVFVFASGILGLAALQISSKQSGAEAAQRTIAASIALDLLERMRLNTAAVPSPLATYVTDGATLDGSTVPGNLVDCSTVECTPYQLADFDLASALSAALGASEQRNGANVGGLSNPVICVNGPADGASGTYQVTIVWRGKAALPNANTSNTCGTASGLFGDSSEYRRILTVSTYLSYE